MGSGWKDGSLSVAQKRKLLGASQVEDEIRPESREAVSEAHRLGIQVSRMITGDSKTVADSVAPAHREIG